VVEVPAASYPDLAKTMERFRERDIDFADAALVWLVKEARETRVAGFIPP
jgi:hypothetical protein